MRLIHEPTLDDLDFSDTTQLDLCFIYLFSKLNTTSAVIREIGDDGGDSGINKHKTSIGVKRKRKRKR